MEIALCVYLLLVAPVGHTEETHLEGFMAPFLLSGKSNKRNWPLITHIVSEE